MSRYQTAKTVINNAATECGITAVTDPFASADPAFVQLCALCSSAGQELLGLHEWQRMQRTHEFTSTVATTEEMPTDFAYMIDQTGWNRSAGFPLAGPMTSQMWAYLLGNAIGLTTIYVTFRMEQGVLQLLPDPMVPDQDIAYSYMSRNWVLGADGTTYKDSVTAADDTVLYEGILLTKFLKLRFLEAKGFDTTAAMNQFNSVFMQWTGRDVSAPILSMARSDRFPYLGYYNIPDTGYGV